MRDEYDLSNAKRGVFFGKVEKKGVSDRVKPETTRKAHAVCVETFDEKSLILRKIYSVVFLGNGFVEVVDEQGGREVYPEKLFLPLSLSEEVESILEKIAV